MGKSKKQLTLTSQLLLHLYLAGEALRPIFSFYELRKLALFGSRASFNTTVYRLYKRGWIKMVDKDAQKFIKLTGKGELEALVAKAKMPVPEIWDKKWRMIIFDIPEDTKEKHHLLRDLLKHNDFYKLQASVYINPYPLNREAIKYLKETRLNQFIRIIKVEEMDNDTDLKKHFNLK